MSLPARPAIYARISYDPDETRLGVDRQLQACHEEAAKRAWPHPVEYVDNDVSAYRRGARRPQWERLLADIEARRVDGVIVWHDDRLTRQPRDFERFLDVCERAGIAQNYVTATGNTNLSTPDGLLAARMMAAVANFESAHKSERVKAKRLQEAAAGRPQTGGVRPFGYLGDKSTPHEIEAPIFKALAERHIAGEGASSLARWLVDQGVPTVNGGRWSYGRVVAMLTNPRYAAIRVHRGLEVSKGDWTPLISEAQHRALVAKHSPRPGPQKRAVRTFLLTGLLHCAKCNHRLVGMRTSNGTRRYVCPARVDRLSCAGVSITADPLERLIAQVVLFRLDSPELAAALEARPPESATEHEAAIQAARIELLALQAAYDADLLTLQEWLGAKKKHEQAIESAQLRLLATDQRRSATEYVGLGAQLADAWTDFDLGRQRAIVDAVIDQVHVLPVGRGARPSVDKRTQIRFRA